VKIKNPASISDPWAPDFEVGSGSWIYRVDNRSYTVRAIRGEQVIFVDGADGLLVLMVNEAAKLMRPT
jgi:hypothetical protein